jgi:hypothetical protein
LFSLWIPIKFLSSDVILILSQSVPNPFLFYHLYFTANWYLLCCFP